MPRRRTVRTDSRKATRSDGLVNVISGLGVAGRDKSIASTFAAPLTLTSRVLEDIYRSGGIGRRIVDLPVHEMTREWFEIEGDEENDALGYLEALHAKMTFQAGLRWANLYGGSAIVVGLDDGGELEDEVNEPATRNVVFLHVYDRWQVTWLQSDLYNEPDHPKFGQPKQYRISPYTGTGGPFTVHESRVLIFKGAPLPPRAEREQLGWGDSVLQAPYEAVRNFVAGHAHTANILEEWSVGVLAMKGLTQKLAAAGGEAKVRTRLGIVEYGKSILRAMLLDADGETYTRNTQTVAGLPDTLDRLAQRVSAETGIPVTLLMGEPPSGLQATGESSRANWYDEIHGQQETKLQQPLEKLVRYVFISRDGPTRGKEPDNWKIKFKPLWQMTPTEDATLRSTVATTDNAYVTSGVLDPEEVAVSRFGSGRWSPETVIDTKARVRPERVEEDEDEDRDAKEGNGAG